MAFSQTPVAHRPLVISNRYDRVSTPLFLVLASAQACCTVTGRWRTSSTQFLPIAFRSRRGELRDPFGDSQDCQVIARQPGFEFAFALDLPSTFNSRSIGGRPKCSLKKR